MDKKNEYEVNLKQNIIVSIIMFIVSAILLYGYNFSRMLFGVTADSKLDLLSFTNILPILIGLLYLSSIIILSLSLYCEWKDTDSKKYLISFIILVVIGLVVGFTVYLDVILTTITNMLVITILIYAVYKFFNMKESEFVSPFECITIVLIDLHIFIFLLMDFPYYDTFKVGIILWLLIFTIIYRQLSIQYNNQGVLKTLGIALLVLFIVSPLLRIFVEIVMSFGFMKTIVMRLKFILYELPFFNSLHNVKINIEILYTFIMVMAYWLFSIKIIQYTYRMCLSKEDFSLREHSILRFNKLFNISILIAVYILLKVIIWEEISIYYLDIKDVEIATDAITFLSLIILFTDERLKSSKETKIE